MQAIIYLIKRHYINRFKRYFSSVISAVITLLGVFGIGFTIVKAFTIKASGVDITTAQTILAGILLFIGMILYNSFLSRDSGILTMADANFLFTGPFEKREVLAYLLISTAPASMFTGFFMCFYFPYLLGSALTVPRFLVVLLIVSLLFGCIYLSYYYLYIADAEKPGLKKKAQKILYVFVCILVIAFIILLTRTGFNVQSTAKRFFTSSLYNAVPLFGWAKWAIYSLLTGDIVLGFIPATSLLVIANAILCYALYNAKYDFYEKTMEDSVNLQKIMDDAKVNGNTDARSLAKLKKTAASVRFGQGAAAIYSRQMLESNKLSLVSKYREGLMGLFYVAFGVIFNLDFNFVIVMAGFGALSMSLNDSWHRDFKKPYVFLIPASSFSKVLYSVLPGIIKTAISGSISITIGALIYKINPVNIISYLLIFASFVVLFVFAEVLTYRMIGPGLSAMAVTFIRMLFAMAACIPAGIVLIVIAALQNGTPGLLMSAACMMGVNCLLSILLAFLSRGIFENSEVMD